MKRFTVIAAVAGLLFTTLWPTIASGGGSTTPAGRSLEGLSPAQRAAILHGALPKDRALLAQAKAEAGRSVAARAGSSSAGQSGGPPIIREQFEGIRDFDLTPPDTTGAIGPTRYVELVNDVFGIYDRSGNQLDFGSLAEFTNRPPQDFIFDPQIIWDPGTQRFYYAIIDAVSSSDNRIAFGWSKTASPNTASDWCQYAYGFGYGSDFPDYPKLGDTENFILVGINVFGSGIFFTGADIAWVEKPGPGTTCPAPASLNLGKKADLKDANGTDTFTPVPMNQIDDDSRGWIVATDSYDAQRNVLNLFRVTRDPATGDAVIQGTGTPVGIPSYSHPPSAPQQGTNALLDTLDARFTQGMSSIHPALGTVVLWTQHAIAGGAGSVVRYYGVDPSIPRRVLGTVSNDSLYVFNGAISSDRANDGVTAAFGNSIVVGFSTSSSSTFPAIGMVSRIGTQPQSGFVRVKQSLGFNQDHSCPGGGVCRWGDYSGANPDPIADPLAAHGVVWLANQWNDPAGMRHDNKWRTWIWAASP
jgi:hypothetical protein